MKIFPAIHIYWEKYQKEALEKVKNESSGEVIVAGDGRHDSMGHSAKFCAYTIFCCNIPMIIHFKIVQVLFFYQQFDQNVFKNLAEFGNLAYQLCLPIPSVIKKWLTAIPLAPKALLKTIFPIQNEMVYLDSDHWHCCWSVGRDQLKVNL